MKGLKAVVFGAGKMACGLLGHLLARSGYETLFVARRPEVIEAINRHHGYRLIVAGERAARLAVRNCAALSFEDEAHVLEAVAGADVVLTGMGIANLSAISPLIAEGLWQRSQAYGVPCLNVVACENLPGAGAYLRHLIVSAAPLRQAMAVDSVGGFSAALTRRIMTGGGLEDGELTFAVDAMAEGDADLAIDLNGLKVPLPLLMRTTFTEEFPALVLRKLFLLNCAQAVVAYLGYREDCHFMHEAAVHPHVAPVVRGAVGEARAALEAEFPQERQAIRQDAAEALAQIRNPELADTVSRVARDPRRKLSPRERLVGPARLAARHHLPHDNLCLGIAAALAYDDPSDAQAVAMQQAIAAESVEKVLTEDCGLLPYEDLARAVKQDWLALLRRARPAGSLGVGSAECAEGTGDESGSHLDAITSSLALELGEHHDPVLVRTVLARVREEFRRARIWTHAGASMGRRASEHVWEARS